jgi:hypothetical protein
MSFHVPILIQWLSGMVGSLATQDPFSKSVLDQVAAPLLTSAQFLIPAAVAISGLHKMMEHRESGGSFLVDMVTKGGGAVLVLQLIKSITGVT